MVAARYELIIFDFDGTLADSLEIFVAAINTGLKEFGFPRVPEEKIRKLVGIAPPQMVKELIGERPDPKRLKVMIQRVLELFDQVAPARVRLFDGVRSMLVHLEVNHLKLAVATSQWQASVAAQISALGLDGVFDRVLGGDEVSQGKPHPEMVRTLLEGFQVKPGRTLLVGDTTFDLEMGRAAGVDTCGVTYGSHSREQLEAEHPTYLAHAPFELLEFIIYPAMREWQPA